MKHTVHVRGREAAEAMGHLVAAARHRLKEFDMEFHWDDDLGRWEPQCTGATLTFELEEGKPMSNTYEEGIRAALAIAEEWAANTVGQMGFTAKQIAKELESKLQEGVSSAEDREKARIQPFIEAILCRIDREGLSWEQFAKKAMGQWIRIAPPRRPQRPCGKCHGARVLCYKDMQEVPCPLGSEVGCANTGHHQCHVCKVP